MKSFIKFLLTSFLSKNKNNKTPIARQESFLAKTNKFFFDLLEKILNYVPISLLKKIHLIIFFAGNVLIMSLSNQQREILLYWTICIIYLFFAFRNLYLLWKYFSNKK